MQALATFTAIGALCVATAHAGVRQLDAQTIECVGYLGHEASFLAGGLAGTFEISDSNPAAKPPETYVYESCYFDNVEAKPIKGDKHRLDVTREMLSPCKPDDRDLPEQPMAESRCRVIGRGTLYRSYDEYWHEGKLEQVWRYNALITKIISVSVPTEEERKAASYWNNGD